DQDAISKTSGGSLVGTIHRKALGTFPARDSGRSRYFPEATNLVDAGQIESSSCCYRAESIPPVRRAVNSRWPVLSDQRGQHPAVQVDKPLEVGPGLASYLADEAVIANPIHNVQSGNVGILIEHVALGRKAGTRYSHRFEA